MELGEDGSVHELLIEVLEGLLLLVAQWEAYVLC